MTELETIQRAKMYMDKLANGINPIDDTQVPENDIINNVRLSRCFFFVSDILRRVIENGGMPQSQQVSKPEKDKFCLLDEQKRLFELSDIPIPISDIAKRLNALIDAETMTKITYQQIRAYLATVGMLADSITVNGGHAKHPTEAGKDLGISVDKRTGQNGDYQVVLYDKNAQQFILDNIESIAITHVIVESPEMRGKPWTKEQEDLLVEMHNNGTSIGKMAHALQRSSSGVRGRLKKLGLIANYLETE